MAKRSESEYIFADSYVGSNVARLMTTRDVMRVATSPDLESASVILREFGYDDDKYLHEGFIEPFIRREQRELYEEVFSVLPDRKELEFNLYPYDYNNLKVCLKAEQMGVVPDQLTNLMSTASIPPAVIVALVRDRNYDRMPPTMQRGVKEAIDAFARSKDPQVIDLILDRTCYLHMLEQARESEDDFLIEYVKMLIDAVNLSAFLRLRNLGKSWNFLKEIFIDGGHITSQMLIASFEEPASRVAEKVEPYGFGKAVAEGGKVLKETGSIATWEKLRDDAIMHYLKTAKFESFGVHPIQAYLCAKETEIDNLRVALSGVLFGFTPAEVEERLKESYV
ncbi:MAG: V-type ATPase subunit [Anaerovoracaceae bacterium]|jgi:V/A-type H+-transporting ATPase subunit C